METMKNFYDEVEQIHIALFGEGETDGQPYRSYLDAVYDGEAVEGSIAADNVMAAIMIRDYARWNAFECTGTKNLHSIVKALNIVLRRYRLSRKERRGDLSDHP